MELYVKQTEEGNYALFDQMWEARISKEYKTEDEALRLLEYINRSEVQSCNAS